MAESVKNDSASASVAASTTTPALASGVEDSSDITKRAIANDYKAYKPISLDPGNEQIRLMQIMPAETDDEDEEIVCALFDVPPNWADVVVYTALSYCWGDLTEQKQISLIHTYQEPDEETRQAALASHKTEDDQDLPGKTTILVASTSNKQKFNVTVTLYEALKSFRKAAPRIQKDNPMLDWQPIWVDATCINQGNSEERNCQVSIMGKIYSKSWCVWIWLGESEEVTEGLNLIQQMTLWFEENLGEDFDALDPKDDQIARLFALRYKLHDEILGPESCFRILDKLFGLPYFRRMWVVQEATIAADRTFVHTAVAQVPWRWLIVAHRFRALWRKLVPSAPTRTLPVIWAELLREQLARAKQISDQGKGSLMRYQDGPVFARSLYWLFVSTYEEFDATDLRDKLFALLDLSAEAVGSKKKTLQGLAPDYSPTNTTSQVFRTFTRWCIAHKRDLSVLSLLCGGPRRLLPNNISVRIIHNGVVPNPYLDARTHPSWAIWPETGGPWSVSSLTKVQNVRNDDYNLTSQYPALMLDISKHPRYKIPDGIANRLIALGGQRIGVVKSNFRMPIRVYPRKEPSPIGRKYISEELAQDMSKYEQDFEVVLTNPYIDGQRIKGGLIPLWCYIQRDWVGNVEVDDQAVPVVPQQWLGGEGGRYAGREEYMFRDFLETLLLSPIYRGDRSLDDDKDDKIPSGPWDDPHISTSFALAWGESGDPRMEYLPPRLGQHFRDTMVDVEFPREKAFPYLFLGHGKSFFITEDERMGLCSQDVQPGDIVVALRGSAVPFVLHPMEDEPDLEGEDWSFEGDQGFKKGLFRFMGECYLHESMTSQFMEDQSANVDPPEVFMIC